jgi:hypothetical protein
MSELHAQLFIDPVINFVCISFNSAVIRVDYIALNNGNINELERM